MPFKPKRARRRIVHLGDLTLDEIVTLASGCYSAANFPSTGGNLQTEQDLEPLWQAIREEALEVEGCSPGTSDYWPSRPGHRSAAWWTWEASEPPSEHEAEDQQLERLGQLSDAEKRWLHRYAVRQMARNCVQPSESALVARWARREH